MAELAQQLGRPADGLYYHLRLLTRGGLLRELAGHSRAGRGERRYRIHRRRPSKQRTRPLELVHRPADRANREGVGRVVDSMLRITRRDFARAMASAGVVVQGRRRELWAARGKGWVNAAELEEMNQLLGRGTGRRDLNDLALPEERVELSDPHLEQLALDGKVARHGLEESLKLGHRRASRVRVVIARVRYKTVDAEGNADVITTALPDEMLPRALLAPSMAAHVIMENVGKGLPLFRLEDTFAREGVPIDRGTLARMKKLVGDKLALTVVRAMHQHALRTAFCISTDATGVCVQPIYSHEKGSQPCKKGHILPMIADRDHILFEYLEQENGPAIYEKFRGFSGYVQADAKAVLNLLFADEAELERKAAEVEHDGCARTEVGCWYHCRKRFWEAATAKCQVAREGLVRIGRIFELDASWRDKPPSEIKALRGRLLKPHVEHFFEWVAQQRAVFRQQRGHTRSALEYAHNQREVLARFFEDGRLVLTNNGAERAIKAVALGRKAWLFCGSDDHAKSTAALYSLIASARLHGLDPEEYLRCLIRLVPLWNQDRMIELAPLFWERTRARLDAKLLEAELGTIAVPVEPLDASAPAQQQAAD